jgi:hypothetical protein
VPDSGGEAPAAGEGVPVVGLDGGQVLPAGEGVVVGILDGAGIVITDGAFPTAAQAGAAPLVPGAAAAAQHGGPVVACGLQAPGVSAGVGHRDLPQAGGAGLTPVGLVVVVPLGRSLELGVGLIGGGDGGRRSSTALGVTGTTR